jgi:hypothetical protein
MDDRDLLALASRQGGVVSRAQAVEHGHTRSSIDHRLRTGSWTRAGRGIYRLLPAGDERDVLRGAMVALPDPVVSHASAGRLLGLTGIPRTMPTVTVPAHTTHRFDGVRVCRSIAGVPAEHRTVRHALPTTTPARTVVDLAAHLPGDAWDRLAQEAVVAGACSMRDLAEVASVVCGQGRPGSAAVGAFLEGTESSLSTLERRVADLLRPLAPVAQYPAPWNQHHRLDFAFPDARVAVECDSRRWHATRDRFDRDRRRDREALRHGWIIVRVTWTDVADRPGEVVRTIVLLLDERTVGPRSR